MRVVWTNNKIYDDEMENVEAFVEGCFSKHSIKVFNVGCVASLLCIAMGIIFPIGTVAVPVFKYFLSREDVIYDNIVALWPLVLFEVITCSILALVVFMLACLGWVMCNWRGLLEFKNFVDFFNAGNMEYLKIVKSDKNYIFLLHALFLGQIRICLETANTLERRLLSYSSDEASDNL